VADDRLLFLDRKPPKHVLNPDVLRKELDR